MQEILKSFAEFLGDEIIEELEGCVWTKDYTFTICTNSEGEIIIDTLDGHLTPQEVINANCMTSYSVNFKEIN